MSGGIGASPRKRRGRGRGGRCYRPRADRPTPGHGRPPALWSGCPARAARNWDACPVCGASPAAKIAAMNRDLEMNRELERTVERRIRLWVLEQEFERKRESQRRAAQLRVAYDAQK
jgi:hypothetical protein